uniref:uncharacterized protein n=1 Tax=Centroberyx gerrardi TaxID=166262 RepID=UPI003AACE45B
MAQPKPPVPRPRTFPPVSKKWSYTPQSPTYSPQPGAASSPPPVAPKKWTVRRSSGGCDTQNNSLQIAKISDTEEDKQLVPSAPLGPPAVYNPACMGPMCANQGLVITHTMQRVTIYEGTNDVTDYPIYENVVTRKKSHKVVVQQQSTYSCEVQPPPPPTKPPVRGQRDSTYQNETLDANYLMDWWKKVTTWECLSKEHKLKGKEETKIITVKARRIYNAIQLYIVLLTQHGGTLKNHIDELLSIADNLDKVSKGTKIAGITGGATGALGGVAVAAGVILSPFTMGASLALSAVGVGVAAAGGITGASAAIAHKVNATQDKKKIEKTFQEYEALMADIQGCLTFVNEGMEQLRQHDLSTLSGARAESLRAESMRVARVAELATAGGTSLRAARANSKAAGLMQGFALGMDFFFTQGKDDQKLKKGLESKFAKKIRKVAKELDNGLDELIQTKELFKQYSERCE